MSIATERKAGAMLLRRMALANDGALDIEAAAAALEGRFQRRVLVVGSGGREHAIAWKLSQSPDVADIMVSPGNGGTARAGGKIRNVAKMAMADVPDFAIRENIDLVVVGPEQPLVDGLADMLRARHVPCFGPSKLAAEIEASKAWAKDFMGRHGIPTSKHATFNRGQLAEAEEYARTCGFPLVVKASGLAAGKGVLIPDGLEATLTALREVMVDNAFGSAGDVVVLEERMQGPEASMLAFCDGKSVRMMPAAQDHKRIYDGDRGLNTGGMGAYAPAPLVTPDITARVLRDVMEPTVKGLAEEGRPFVGVLYAGMMMTPDDGPRVVEFNCRFGDPETQVLLPLLNSDLLHVMESCALGSLDSMGDLQWKDAHAVTIVAASPGYPVKYPKGRRIWGLEDVPHAGGQPGSGNEVMVFHAGTRLCEEDNTILETSGGRVLVVTSVSTDNLRSAVSGAYAGMRALDFEGMQYRYDIAARALTKARPLRVGVLGSTRGTDLDSLLDALSLGRGTGISIEVVVSNRKSSQILAKAESAGIPTHHIPCPKGTPRDVYDAAVTSVLEEHGPLDVVLMIGYMRIVSPSFTAQWANRLVNVHPSLLPEFAGGMDMDVHAEVLKAGKKVSGCTVHFVTDVIDGGPVVCRRHVHIDDSVKDAEALKAKVQIAEGEALLSSLRAFQDGTPMSIANGERYLHTKESKQQMTYADAGVSIEEGNALIEDIKPHCKATRRPGCNASLGGFGGCFDLRAAGWAERLQQQYSLTPLGSDSVLVACTDGVGTKLKVAQIAGRHDTVGIDLVAMSVNDLIVQGAEPLFFLDYFACGKLDRGVASAVVKGIAKGCIDAGCGLIGGETAEMPSMYEDGDYDLAGFAVGAVRRSALLPQKLCAGDVVIGLTSSGVHSNGFSLVRKLVSVHGFDWQAEAPFTTKGPYSRLCDVILEPTRIYVKALLPLLGAQVAEESCNASPAMPNAAAMPGKIKALAHITGGGLVENIPRVLSEGLTVHIDATSWKEACPPVFGWIAGLGSVPVDDLFRTFNCGIGMCVFVSSEDAQSVLAELRSRGESAYVIGRVHQERSLTEERVVVTGTPF